MFGIGPMEMVIVGIVGLLLFGKRLPDIARSLGSSVVEFKKGISGVEDETKAIRNELLDAADTVNNATKLK
jgi:sec-independent protein translocase protein TatA